MLVHDETEFASWVCITSIGIEDLNLIIDANAACLSKSLDVFGNVTRLAHAFQFWCEYNVEHYVCSFVRRFLSPFKIINDFLLELLLDFKHTFFDLAIYNLDLSFRDVILDLVVCKIIQGVLEAFAELLAKLLSTLFMICSNSIFEVRILIIVVLDLHAVEFLLDISAEGLISV